MTGLSEQEVISRLRLLLSENVGPVTFKILLDYFGSAQEALGHLPEFAKRGGRLKKFTPARVQQAEEQIKLANRFETRLLFWDHPEYPSLLGQIEAAPPLLFVRGRSLLFQKKAIAVVGTRNASLNGKNMARRISFELAEKDICVVSGLARGIDGAAHTGALAALKGGTIAVLGTAIDQIYPVEHKDLYEQVAQKGCLVSEFMFGSKMLPGNFPRRNRIISGLALGTLVIEAQTRSGSLITARDALSQGREVFAVPGSPLDPRSEGPNQLIREGATLVRRTQDILDEINSPMTLCEKTTVPQTPFFIRPDTDTLDEARRLVLENLSLESTSIDALARETGLPVSSINIVLVELELAGRLVRQAGQRVTLVSE